MITKHDVAQKLSSYLRHEITIDDIVEWAESAMLKEDFDQDDLEVIREVIARLGLADVKAFGLTWEDCREMMYKLGYEVQVNIAIM